MTTRDKGFIHLLLIVAVFVFVIVGLVVYGTRKSDQSSKRSTPIQYKQNISSRITATPIVIDPDKPFFESPTNESDLCEHARDTFIKIANERGWNVIDIAITPNSNNKCLLSYPSLSYSVVFPSDWIPYFSGSDSSNAIAFTGNGRRSNLVFNYLIY